VSVPVTCVSHISLSQPDIDINTSSKHGKHTCLNTHGYGLLSLYWHLHMISG